jgi:phage/plasmid primase-like uncharacterized protein
MSLESLLADLGAINVGHIPDDGELYRFHVKGKTGKNAWAVKFAGGEAGKYGCWGVTDEDGIFWSDKGAVIDDAKREKWRLDSERIKARKIEGWERVARECASKWEAIVGGGESEYLQRKGVRGHGVKVDSAGVLWIPLRDKDGKLWNLQRITSGEKLFESGGRVSGCYFIIEGTADRVVLCEGYATGASIHEATGYRVIVCFNADNMVKVAEVFKDVPKVVVAADNDESGKGEAVARKIKDLYGIGYVIPRSLGDFNDQLGDIVPLLMECVEAFSLAHYLDDKTKAPDDLISPRVLVPNGMCLFGGAPKVGKSDFILSWLMHMAAGVEFMGMKPARPLRVFYLQAEIGYHYIKERIAQVDIERRSIDVARGNMVITPRMRMLLDADGVVKVGNAIKAMGGCDIIAIDPLRNVFDGESENDNAEMIKFLVGRVEALRAYSGGDAGIIMAHHTKKVAKDELAIDPFLAFSGASSLRGFYNTGMMMYRPDEQVSERVLAFELRDGKPLPNMHLDKIEGRWLIIPKEQSRVAHESTGKKNDNERARKVHVVCEQVRAGIERGDFYTRRGLSELLAGRFDLGSSATINRMLGEMIAQGELLLSGDGKLVN